MSLSFDPRARYLTGLGAGPSARSLVGRRRYNRNFIGAFDPRRRYLSGPAKHGWGLRGLGDDGSGFDVTYSAPLPTQLGPDPIYSAPPATPIPFLPTLFPTAGGGTTTAYTPSAPPINFIPTGSVPAPPTAAQISMAATGAKPLVPSILGPAVAAPAPSWFAQQNPTLGISNSTLALGFGFLLVVMVAGSGGKRR
jgi:hypothetical protein